MVLINNKEIPKYDLDTDQSVKNRIASNLHTLSKYLYFPNGTNDWKGQIQAVDILQLIKTHGRDSIDFEEFITENKERIKDLDLAKDVLHPWIVYNEQFNNPDYGDSLILNLSGYLVDKGYFESDKIFQQFLRSKDLFKKKLELQIKQNTQSSKTESELYSTFETVEDGIPYTHFSVEKVNIEMTLDLKNISILELFNYMILNESIPYAMCQNYYKMLKDYVPADDWTVKIDSDTIFLKVNEKQIVEPSKYKDYISVMIKMLETTKISFNLVIERGNLLIPDFQKRLFNIFPSLELKVQNTSETEVVGLFYFPNERLDSYVFADLVLNDILFSRLISIDESTKATKKKNESGQPWLYIHFNHPTTGHVTGAITQKNVDYTDSELKDQNREIFQHGEPYIRVRARGKDINSIERFQELFSKLLVLYNKKYEEIVSFYKKIIPDFGDVIEYIVPQLKKHSDMAPDIFVKGYTRTCTVARMPTIINNEEANEYENVMVFPRPVPKSGIKYLSDGVNQQHYVCKNPEYPFPGVQVNKLANAEVYPFVPCCFKTNPDKPGDVYRQYFYGEEIEVREKKQQNLISTDKILNTDSFGELSDTVKQLFENLDPEYKYIRMGVAKSPSSFLNAVMIGMYEYTGLLDVEIDDRLKEVLKIRKKLNPVLARQCMYDSTIKTIKAQLRDETIYLDPNLYLPVLENYFNCNIFLFNTEKMILPRHTQAYYKYHRNAPCVFIYEHLGSESDHAKYPQCELIVKWNKQTKNEVEYSFTYDTTISKQLNKVFRLLNESYALTTEIEETVFPIEENKNIKLLSQVIDGYGKTRCIDVELKNTIISIITTPIPPLDVEEKDSKEPIIISDSNIAQTAIGLLGDIQSQTFNLDGLNGTIGNVKITIPIVQTKLDLPREQGLYYSYNKFSELNKYNKLKKLTRYIIEYTFWFFSKFLSDENIKTITDKVLARFAKEFITLDNSFQYENIPKIFSIDNSGIVRDKKIILHDLDTLKRLMYVLKLFSIQNIKSLREYKDKTVITNYYVDITDFDSYPNQVILQGEDSLEKWLQENKKEIGLYNIAIPGNRYPYFFRNELIAETIFLAQNVNNIDSAIRTALNWQKKGYNLVSDSTEPSKYEFTLYSFKNSNSIDKVFVNGEKKPNSEIRILGYKLNENTLFTVLLEL